MKKNLFLRITALFILFLTVIPLFGCGNTGLKPIKPTEEDLRVVGTVDGFEVTYEELRYFTMNYKKSFESLYGSDIWTDKTKAESYREELKTSVYSALLANYAVLSLCKDVYISKDEEEIQNAVADYMDNFLNEYFQMGTTDANGSYGSNKAAIAQYKTELAENYMTDHLMRFFTSVDYCQNELLYVYTDDLGVIDNSDDAAYEYIKSDNFARTLHIYIACNKTDKDVADKLKEAEAVRLKWLAGESYTELVRDYSDDVMMTTLDGYYFARGEMVEDYENAAFALKDGEISEVVGIFDDTSYPGYYIIQRLEKDSQYMVTNFLTLRDQYIDAMFFPLLDEKRNSLTFTPNEYGASVDLVAMQ